MKSVKIIGISALTLALAACGGADNPSALPDSDKARFSYGIGLKIGQGLKKQKMELSADALTMGIKDALEGRQAIDDATIQAAANAVRQHQMDKQKALADDNAKKGEAFLAENGKREGVTTTQSGLQYEIIQAVETEETKKPTLSDVVSVHYHGTLTDGSVFDSSIKRGKPAQFPVRAVIKGWQEALQLMKPGEKWKLYIPAELAYGARSPSPKIPANSALVFEVELLDIKAPE
ncbi:MAG: peptidylprolyl isomerase [Gammaproteobacteria bacterium]|nr:MAG: peptidylprolyl isomerase [Pseudomonadota bacterium]PIE38159.1 MAG: peptidylprolyl isomerase [Gammaproteobacteria bacterium]